MLTEVATADAVTYSPAGGRKSGISVCKAAGVSHCFNIDPHRPSKSCCASHTVL